MNLWIIGNSHVNALARAMPDVVPEAEPVSGTRRWRCRSGSFETIGIFQINAPKMEDQPFSERQGTAVTMTNAEMHRRLDEAHGVDRISGDDVWAVSMGTHTTRFIRHGYWDQHQASSVAQAPAAPVSMRQVEAMAAALQQPVRAFFLQLKEAGIRSVVVSAPPLRRDNPCVANRPGRTSLELDRVCRDSMRAFLTAHDIPFVAAPDEARDTDGHLRADLENHAIWKGFPDVTHGNRAYGALMLRAVLSRAEQTW